MIQMWSHNLHLHLFTILSCSLLCYSVQVHNAEELIDLFKKETGSTLKTNIELLDDLDFSGSGLTFPLGVDSDGNCKAFSGTFQGNGYFIKGLVLNNTNSKVFNSSGLFCSLKDAIVENLNIDSSCSFTGYEAGGLSVTVSESVSCFNVTNRAVISGSYKTGGLIGFIEGIKQETIIVFEGCLNHGAVSGSSFVGGFVGLINDNNHLITTFSKCTNNGAVTGYFSDTGGFVGRMGWNTHLGMSFSKCTNNAAITGSFRSAGGFVGCTCNNNNASVSISKSFSYGTVSHSCSSCSLFYSGGFIGRIYSDSQTYSLSLFIINSANKCSVSTQKDIACGLFCVDKTYNYNVNTTVINSANKGRISSPKYAYGIANSITSVRNVVSMGDVSGSSGSYTFWSGLLKCQSFLWIEEQL